MNRQQAAVQCFNSGCNCSQAIVSVFAPTYELPQETALKLASGFGGGIGGTGGVCGALTGACMVLGLAFGPSAPGDKAAKDLTYQKVRILTEEFKRRTGSLMCRDLLGFDLASPDGYPAARQSRAFDKCDAFVRIAADILDPMLQ